MIAEESLGFSMAGGPVKDNPACPDGGYGWVVVVASFFLQFLTIGVTYTFGILMVALRDPEDGFGTSESATAWIGSIQPFLLYFTGIVCGSLIERFGFRLVTISGCLLTVLGFISSAFVQNMYVLYFTYGCLTGVGNGLMYVTSMVAVQHYFLNKRAMATGLAVAGSGVGTLVFGYLTQYLIDEVGWRKCLIIEGVIMLLGVVCGALMRPLPELAVVDEKDIKLEESRSIILEREYQVPISKEEEAANSSSSSCCSSLTGIIDCSLYKDPRFDIFVVAMFCFATNLHVPYTFTPARALSLGIPAEKAALLVSIMGISNVGSRLVFGFIADYSERLRFVIGGSVLFLSGLASALVPLYTNYTLMAMYSTIFGVCSGCFASLFPVLLVDLMGVEDIGKTLGQAMASSSGVFLIAAPLSGLIIDKTGNIDLPFIIVGCICAVGGLVYFTTACFGRQRTDYEIIPDSVSEPSRRLSQSRGRSFISQSITFA